MEENKLFKSGFVSIVGMPNMGKSTLMNAMVGERLSIVTSKAQTTRHRIMGIISGNDFQIVYSDTPGLLEPAYELQKNMMGFVNASLEDADIILYVVDVFQKPEIAPWIESIKKREKPIIIVINKIDIATQDILVLEQEWKLILGTPHCISLSALTKEKTGDLFDLVLGNLPFHPPYFDNEQLTDKPERFFAAEFVREAIFVQYKKEIPYCCEVVVTEYKEKEGITVIKALIYVERESQKGIVIGTAGAEIKKLGIESRKSLEEFIGNKVFLELSVKVEQNWRKMQNSLQKFGYKNK